MISVPDFDTPKKYNLEISCPLYYNIPNSMCVIFQFIKLIMINFEKISCLATLPTFA